MAHRKKPFDWRTTLIAAGGVDNDLRFGIVEQDRLYSLQWVALRIGAQVATLASFLKTIGDTEHFFAEQPAPAANELLWLDQAPIFLQPGETFIARVNNPGTGDILKLYLSGWYATIPATRGAPVISELREEAREG